MKVDVIVDAIGMIDDDIIQEADMTYKKQKQPIYRQWKWVTVMSCLCIALFIMVVSKSPSPTTPPPETMSGNNIDDPKTSNRLPELKIPSFISDGVGFSGVMAYDISELNSGYSQHDVMHLATLPVYKNTLEPDETGLAKKCDEQKMRDIMMDISTRLGLDHVVIQKEMIVDDIFNLTVITKEVIITVDYDLTTTIEFHPSLQVPSEYRYCYGDGYDQTKKSADYFLNKYSKLINMTDPQINIHSEGYNIDLKQYFQIEFFEGSDNAIMPMLNSYFNRVVFYPSEDGHLEMLRIYHTDLSQKIGDYPIIRSSDAKELLLKGHYITNVPYDMESQDYVKKCELVYLNQSYLEYFMPYYQFYVELPEEKSESDSQLKTYGLYYVPAIEEQYLENMDAYQGQMN